MKTFLTFVSLFLFQFSFAQKQILDTATWDNWPIVGPAAITDDGNYVVYTINHQPKGSATLVFKAVNNEWEKQIPFVHDYRMISKNRVVFKRHDTLTIYDLDKQVERFFKEVTDYNIQSSNKSEWICYQKTDTTLNVYNIKTNLQTQFKGVLSYLVVGNSTLLLKRKNGLYKAAFDGRLQQLIYEGEFENLIADRDGKQIAFVTGIENQIKVNYYNNFTGKIQSIDSLISGIDSNLTIDRLERFSYDGSRIFFYVKQKQRTQMKKKQLAADIWSYTDLTLLPKRDSNSRQTPYYAVHDLKKKTSLQLQFRNDVVFIVNNQVNDTFLFTRFVKGNDLERNWNENARIQYHCLNTINGVQTPIEFTPASVSPDGTKVIGYNKDFQQMSCYNLYSKSLLNITNALPIPLVDNDDDIPANASRSLSFAGWVSNKEVLIYDRFDIWLLDLQGTKKPYCITKMQGRRSNITFRLITFKTLNFNWKNAVLSAYDWSSKNNGFYQINNKRLTKLTMGPYFFTLNNSVDVPIFYPAKALNTNIFLVRRESCKESQNYYITSDFKAFKQVSKVNPEIQYNWLSSELIKFPLNGGKQIDGILYKPENFDSTRKYPMVIHFYEKKSQFKNVYHTPHGSGDEINIPWLASQGYLVFTPDIYYTKGKPGESALNSIVSAAKFLSSKSFVDIKKIGIMGHSFGGFETNYIITHSDLFAAAVSSAGISDLISDYSYPMNQMLLEISQLRMGNTLWGDKAGYLENTPILCADKITTPLLLFHNKSDTAVPFNQSVEFFTALRRLNKMVWLIQYDGEGHSVSSRENIYDRTIKIDQFFNYFLNGNVKKTPFTYNRVD
jgi:dipeptidyl aminopeptidase/acylaminoacyl peptidase